MPPRALGGMWFLAFKGDGEGFSIDFYAVLVLVGAVGWATQVLIVDRLSPRTDPIELTVFQFAIVAVTSMIAAVIFEGSSADDPSKITAAIMLVTATIANWKTVSSIGSVRGESRSTIRTCVAHPTAPTRTRTA